MNLAASLVIMVLAWVWAHRGEKKREETKDYDPPSDCCPCCGSDNWTWGDTWDGKADTKVDPPTGRAKCCRTCKYVWEWRNNA